MRTVVSLFVSLSVLTGGPAAQQGGGGGPGGGQGGGPGGGQGGGQTDDHVDLLRSDWRTIDGTDNHPDLRRRGSAGEPMPRFAPAAYTDGVAAPSGADRPSARYVSNLVVDQPASIPNAAGLSDMFWQWGQFLDHDLDETPVEDPEVPFDVEVPAGDGWFDPFGTGAATIPLSRSHQEFRDGVAQQVNELTSFLDGSNVYGSDVVRAGALRTFDGTGRLKVSDGNLLPYNLVGLANAPDADPSLFLAGDIRANEQIGLTAMHTVWVREHNLWAMLLAAVAPDGSQTARHGHSQERRRRSRNLLEADHWDGETIYQLARAIVVAEMQAITYREFLPLLLGPQALPPYLGYDEDVNPEIRNEFATVAYRFGHTMLSPQLLLLDAQGAPVAGGSIALRDAFFVPDTFAAVGVDAIVHGQITQRAQELDPYVVDEVRNFLFGPPGSGGFDLASLNLQRGRDHGMPGLNQLRASLGLAPHPGFAAITGDSTVVANLTAAYGDLALVDAWVGGLAEDPVPGAVVGSTFHEVLRRQFLALRDGDRYWYENYLPDFLIPLVESQTLATVLRRTTGLGVQVPADPFRTN